MYNNILSINEYELRYKIDLDEIVYSTPGARLLSKMREDTQMVLWTILPSYRLISFFPKLPFASDFNTSHAVCSFSS